MALELRPEVRVAIASDRGQVRSENEDACLVVAERGLFVLADGMSGRRSGAIAAQLIISALPELVERELSIAVEPGPDQDAYYSDSLCRAVIALNAQICKRATENPALHGMGATVVAAVLAGAEAHIVHLGDSRAYLLRQGELSRLTADHNLAELLLQLQEISVADAPKHPGRHRLTRYVGMDGEAAPDTVTVVLQPGDRLLLCSDGLTGMLGDPRLGEILEHERDPREACWELVGAANSAGGRDNVSVILIHIDALPVARPEA